MELTELYSLIQKTLGQQGFKLSPLLRNTMDQSTFVLGGELEQKLISEISNYKAFYGMCVEVRKCAHRNGSKADTSYYLAIEDVNRSSFKDYKKVKLMRSQTEPTLVKKITKLMLEYKDMLADRELGKQIDEYLLSDDRFC